MTTPTGFMRRYGLQPPPPPIPEPEPPAPKVGDLRVWSNEGEFPVATPEAGARLIIRRGTLRWSFYGMQVFESDGDWHEWYDDHGDDVAKLADRLRP